MDADYNQEQISFPAIAVVIPAWQPDGQLTKLVEELARSGDFSFVVVDDGSDAEHQAPFDALRRRSSVLVIRHDKNLGKGRALKTGLQAVLERMPHAVAAVTADADGQHRPTDICRVAERIATAGGRVVLGCRSFASTMPFRSKAGNLMTRLLFRCLFRLKIRDTQTGLRGFPRGYLPALLQVEGERYEYEMAVLAHICRSGKPPVEVAIETVYEDGNRSSHFHPARDSLRVYAALVRSYLSSRQE